MPPTQALINPPGSTDPREQSDDGRQDWQIVVSDDDDLDATTPPFGEQICPVFGPLTRPTS